MQRIVTRFLLMFLEDGELGNLGYVKFQRIWTSWVTVWGLGT